MMKIKFITIRDNVILRETKIDGEAKNLMFALENFLSDFGDLDLFENERIASKIDLINQIDVPFSIKINPFKTIECKIKKFLILIRTDRYRLVSRLW